jgi:hypothetical protein
MKEEYFTSNLATFCDLNICLSIVVQSWNLIHLLHLVLFVDHRSDGIDEKKRSRPSHKQKEQVLSKIQVHANSILCCCLVILVIAMSCCKFTFHIMRCIF